MGDTCANIILIPDKENLLSIRSILSEYLNTLIAVALHPSALRSGILTKKTSIRLELIGLRI